MPVELTEGAIRDALAVLEEWDRDGARDAESALRWMCWEDEGTLLLRRYDVQLFVWYQLPRKWLTSLDRKLAAAAALARLLGRLGGRTARCAEIYRSPDSERLHPRLGGRRSQRVAQLPQPARRLGDRAAGLRACAPTPARAN